MTTTDRLAAAIADVQRVQAALAAHRAAGEALREVYTRALAVLAQSRDAALKEAA